MRLLTRAVIYSADHPAGLYLEENACYVDIHMPFLRDRFLIGGIAECLSNTFSPVDILSALDYNEDWFSLERYDKMRSSVLGEEL